MFAQTVFNPVQHSQYNRTHGDGRQDNLIREQEFHRSRHVIPHVLSDKDANLYEAAGAADQDPDDPHLCCCLSLFHSDESII